MKIVRADALVLDGENGDQVQLGWDNRGEPYREGVTLMIRDGDLRRSISCFLNDHEARQLRDKLNELLP